MPNEANSPSGSTKDSLPTAGESLLPSVPDLGKRVSEETGLALPEATRAAEIVQQQMLEASYSGPVPLPFHVRELNEIRTDLGTRLIEDYLAQREHDRKLDLTHAKLSETMLGDTNGQRRRYLSYASRGQILGFVSMLIFVSVALASAYASHPGLAVAFLAPAALGAIRQFIVGFGTQDAPK